MPERLPSRNGAPGFTLPAVMIVAAAMLILAVGLMAIIGIERKTARSFADAKRAELAARAGLEEFRAVLRGETANDDFLVLGGPSPITPTVGLEAPSHLFIARGSGGGTQVNYRYLPLFSTDTLPPNSGTLKAPEIGNGEGDTHTPISGPPWLDKPRVEWIKVRDQNGDVVARYAYWVEDLQGKLDAKTAGNTDGDGGGSVRNKWPFPASGINPEPPSEDELKLDQIVIGVLDPAASEEGSPDLTRKVIDGRPLMLSPGSLLAATGHEAPLKRADTGVLEDPLAAALEKSASPVIQPYEELATVPFAPGISAEAAGRPKRNLNALLGESRDDAVSGFANWIDSALPDFEKRKGGFPDDYLRTLAANAFDYADDNNEPTVKGNAYRGIDGYPLVSEFLMSFRWNAVVREDGRLYMIVTVSTFAELWNMTDQPVDGEAQISFETKFDFQVGANPGISFEEQAADPEVAIPVAVRRDGYLWHAPFRVILEPNEQRVFPSRIQLKIDVGPDSGYVQDAIQVNGGEADDESGYRFRWNGAIVDQSRSNTWKWGGTFNFPKDTKDKPRQFVRANVPAHSHSQVSSAKGPFENNMGDPRMSYYLGTPQAANAYPDNYSPHRRNLRWEVYKGDDPPKPKVYGRVLPSEWPDLGHDGSYGTRPPVAADDQRVDPDDAGFLAGRPTPVREQAPVRLSNEGRFYSATELGRVYDPVMWQPTYLKIADTNSIRSSGKMPANQTAWPDVNKSSPASANYGGGNTLRIGRTEHPKFASEIGWHAAHLLDIFHAGESTSSDPSEREGNVLAIRGNVNLNTATADAIRALAAGMLRQDPLLCQAPNKAHQVTTLMAAPTSPLELGTPTHGKIADRIAEGILLSRPFGSAAGIASAMDKTEKPVFGNREMYAPGDKIHWTDSAAEEVFARVYEASTLRSRNFRIWVIGQAVAPPPRGSGAEPEVLSECRKVFTVFADPGTRREDGSIDPASYRPRVTHENDF